MDYEEKIKKLAEYIRSGEKSEDEFKVGFEIEHFVVDKESLESTSYDANIASIMEEMVDMGYEGIYENGHIMGLSGDGLSISIEPASQFEVAFDSSKSIDDLFTNYKKIMAEIVPLFEERGLLLAEVGYHPKSKIDEIPIIPKKRYDYMYKYFADYGGSMAHNMMKGSTSLQIAIDYENEADFRKKYFVANALSVFLYSVFDNSYIFEGEVYGKRNLRQTIWENCDKDRTGIYPFSFDKDLSYETYAKKILETPSIFINRDGADIYTGTTPFSEIFDEDISDKMIYHALSIVFPDVRAKKYLEIRMPDNVPYPYNFAGLALVKNIFYDKDILSYLYQEFADMDYDTAQSLKEMATKEGINATYKDKKIYEWVLDIIGEIKEDRKFINPLKELMEKQMTPRDIYENLYKKDPQKAIYEFSVNSFIKDNYGKN